MTFRWEGHGGEVWWYESEIAGAVDSFKKEFPDEHAPDLESERVEVQARRRRWPGYWAERNLHRLARLATKYPNLWKDTETQR